MTLATTLIELGSGSSEKTRLLIDALRGEESLRRFMPFDVCLPFVRDAAGALSRDYPGSTSTRSSATFTNTFASCRGDRPAARRWLRSWAARSATSTTSSGRVFRSLAAVLRPGDWFLLGADLVKAKRRLDAAYNDAAGVTVQFNKNVLRVLNRDLGANFDDDLFDHVAGYDVSAS